jgi:hypothetical protein
VVLFYASFVHCARTGHPRSLSSSQHTLSCSLAELPSQIVMSVPESGKDPSVYAVVDPIVQFPDGWSGVKKTPPSLPMQPESPPPPKRRRIAHFQAGQESSIIKAQVSNVLRATSVHRRHPHSQKQGT